MILKPIALKDDPSESKKSHLGVRQILPGGLTGPDSPSFARRLLNGVAVAQLGTVGCFRMQAAYVLSSRNTIQFIPVPSWFICHFFGEMLI